MIKKILISVITSVIILSIATGGTAIVKVNVLEAKYKSQRDILLRLEKHLEWIRQKLYNVATEK